MKNSNMKHAVINTRAKGKKSNGGREARDNVFNQEIWKGPCRKRGIRAGPYIACEVLLSGDEVKEIPAGQVA